MTRTPDIGTANSGFMEGPEGTSFSCASVTGLVGVVAQYFEEGFYPGGAADLSRELAEAGLTFTESTGEAPRIP